MFYFIMIFPVIENNRMKNSDKKSGSQPMVSSADQFGLGIQVFKIDSNKLANQDRNKRKAIKNIENPCFIKSSAPITKKPHVLPSLSVERKMANTTLKEPSRERIERRATIEKKKKPYVPTTSKQMEQKKPPVERKAAQTHQAIKQVVPEQTVSAFKEKEIVYQHYRQSYNELQNFSLRLEEESLNNLKEIKRLRKQKENDQQALEWRMRCKTDHKMLIDTVVNSQRPFFEDDDEAYDEFNLTDYMNNDCKFKYYDEEEPLTERYNDF